MKFCLTFASDVLGDIERCLKYVLSILIHISVLRMMMFLDWAFTSRLCPMLPPSLASCQI